MHRHDDEIERYVRLGQTRQLLKIWSDPRTTVNLLSEKDLENLDPKPKIHKSKLVSNVVGEFRAHVASEQRSTIITIYVVDDMTESYLSWEVINELFLVAEQVPLDEGNECEETQVPLDEENECEETQAPFDEDN